MIQLNDDMAIKADNRNFSVCFRRKKHGKEVWTPEFYFTDLDHLLNKLVNLAIARGINEGSWEAVRNRVDETKAMISKQMDLILSQTPWHAKSGAGQRVFSKNEYPSMGMSHKQAGHTENA